MAVVAFRVLQWPFRHRHILLCATYNIVDQYLLYTTDCSDVQSSNGMMTPQRLSSLEIKVVNSKNAKGSEEGKGRGFVELEAGIVAACMIMNATEYTLASLLCWPRCRIQLLPEYFLMPAWPLYIIHICPRNDRSTYEKELKGTISISTPSSEMSRALLKRSTSASRNHRIRVELTFYITYSDRSRWSNSKMNEARSYLINARHGQAQARCRLEMAMVTIAVCDGFDVVSELGESLGKFWLKMVGEAVWTWRNNAVPFELTAAISVRHGHPPPMKAQNKLLLCLLAALPYLQEEITCILHLPTSILHLSISACRLIAEQTMVVAHQIETSLLILRTILLYLDWVLSLLGKYQEMRVPNSHTQPTSHKKKKLMSVDEMSHTWFGVLTWSGWTNSCQRPFQEIDSAVRTLRIRRTESIDP
ncbi:uncharacterized protein BDR25DRAFT_348328 [Lindgomyces ingoldianus]|uniref:Uncharacterized protein n=1 Tax=Lindgomyces ingoldianus TaxID=673940 RepID=A0ACB6RH32_9PLEO|nr:uncharacterized protein BDR25DRAFT_348328 [Lindgomyces ingoldianus]KAF2478045.1 hypothetical protein BDR25DRAFT_348328 [Lindgomyces ingoldianus]